MKTLLVTGTDTDVGKTVLTSTLAAYWYQYRSNQSLGLMKLMQTGIGDDEHYQSLFANHATGDIVTPLKFKTPVAPPIAAEREGREIPLETVWQALTQLQKKHQFVLVEALGGLGSPVTSELSVADIAGLWRLETVLVVPVKLGAIAQAVANVALARQTKVTVKGIVLSCNKPESEEKLDDWAPIEMVQNFTQVPVLGVLPYFSAEQLKDIHYLGQIGSRLDWEKLSIE
ncbi:MAG: dethiobiotin synthase [Snowella sp.]|nr:dethiobiotin synthase [Snowella sp.]